MFESVQDGIPGIFPMKGRTGQKFSQNYTLATAKVSTRNPYQGKQEVPQGSKCTELL